MKKLFLVLAAAFAMVACQTDINEVGVVADGVAAVEFEVGAPQMRAYSDGSTATVLQYAVYDANGDILPQLTVTDATINGSAKVSLELAKNKTYSVIFWAAAPRAPYAVDFLNKQVKVTYGGDCNDESRDAFYAYLPFEVTGAATLSVKLRRPFAQLNVGTSDLQTAINSGFTPSSSALVVNNVCNVLNLETGVASGGVDAKFAATAIPTGETFPVTGYNYLAMSYVLVGNVDKSAHDVTYTITDGTTTISNTVGAVPMQANYRTNIYGKLLTSQTDIDVEIKPGYETPDNLVYVWDGSEVSEPKTNAADNNIYEIEVASELAWLAGAVNGTLDEEYTRSVAANDFAGKTFRLTKDVDLGGKEWTPIGSSDHIFKGVLDGDGHVVKNLVITGNNSNVGLFGVTHDGEIKNLVVENAKVSGRLNVGVVAGEPYTSKYTNITVQGHVEVNGMSYVGAVGGKNAYADWTNVTVEADATSYVKANSIENGTAYRTYVGGVVGFNGEGGHKFEDISSNIKVEGSTCDVGGLFGIAHYGNKFVNCVCTGDVEIYAAEEADEAQQIGGIAGVWHNGGENVVLTDCSFTGNLSTNLEGVAFYYGGLVGCPYSTTGTGKLIINGKHYVANAEQLQAALNAATGETTLYLGADIVGDVTAVQEQGVKVTIEGEQHKYNGSIKVHSNSNHYADAALTVKNVNFETSTAEVNFIEALENGSERYSTNITVENCTFTATGEAVNTTVGLQVKSSKWVKALNCTATGLHSLVQAQSCDESVLVQKCTVNGKGGVAFKQVKSATVEGTTITATGYGIRFDGNVDNYGIVVKNNNVTAVQPLIVRKMTGKNNTIALEGTNTLTTEAEYQVVITNGSDDEAYVKPTGTYELTGADAYTVFPAPFPVASWDEFTAALAAGEDWIKLTADISTSASYTLTKDLQLELNGQAFAIDNATACLNIGDKNNTTKPNVTFKGGNLNCMVYGLSGNVTIKDVVFGGTISYVSSYQGVVSTKHANLLMENCKMTNVKKSGSTKPRSICTEGRSSGYLILRDCNFKNSNLDRPYFNPINGSTVLELTNCALYGAASNIDIGASCVWSNLKLSGCSGGFTFTISRKSTSLTEAELAVYKAIKKNNSGSMRFLFTDGEKNSL